MHPVVELEVADRELGVAQVVIERVELGLVERAMLAELGVDALERIEEVALARVVQRLAEVHIAKRGLMRILAAARLRGGREAQHAKCEQRTSAHPNHRYKRALASEPLPVAELHGLGSSERDPEQLRLDTLVERERLRVA